MPFTIITPQSGSPLTSVVRASRIKDTSTKLALAGDVAQQFGCTGPCRVSVMVGNGPDTGLIALEPAEHGYSLFRDGGPRSKSLAMTLSRKAGVMPPSSTVTLPYRIEGKRLIIDVRALLPATAKAA